MDAKEYIEEAIKRGKIHHSILLEGGGEEAVEFFAKALLCGNQCQGEGWREEIYRIRPEGKSIKISQIRELLEAIKLKPFAAPRRLVVIEGAELFTPEAANALLKTLEEPPSSTYFLLLTSSPSALLPTVLSRCLLLSWEGKKAAGKRKLRSLQGVKTREDLRGFIHSLYLFLRDWICWKEGGSPLYFPEEELRKASFPVEMTGDFLSRLDKIYSVSDRANLSIARAYLGKLLKEMGIGKL